MSRYAFLAALVLGLYANSWTNSFVNYDDWWLVNNPKLSSYLSLSGANETLFDLSKEARMKHGAEYLPVRDFSSALQFALFKTSPIGYHVVQTFFFAASVALLFAILLQLQLGKRISIFTAVLFAAHPIHVESVSWLSGHKDVLSLFFFLLTLSLYLRRRHFLSLLCFVLALGSKYWVIVLPLLFPFLDRCLGRSFKWSRYLPYWAIASVAGVLSYHVGEVVSYGHAEVGKDFGGIGDFLVMFFGYIQNLCVPVDLQIFYPFKHAVSIFDLRLMAGAISLLFLVGWMFLSNVPPWVALGAAILVVGLLPTLKAPAMHVYADRYLLIPSIGFCLLLASALKRISIGWIAKSLLVLWVANLSLLTLWQNGVWKNSQTLWENAFRGRQPVAKKVKENLSWVYEGKGFRYLQKNELDRAEAYFRKALSLEPDRTATHMNLGVTLAKQKRYDLARNAFSHAERLDSKNPELYFNLARLSVDQGRRYEVLKYLAMLKNLAPKDPRLLELQEWIRIRPVSSKR